MFQSQIQMKKINKQINRQIQTGNKKKKKNLKMKVKEIINIKKKILNPMKF